MYVLLVAVVSVPTRTSDFWLLTLWSVDGCRIACCVHHSVFHFTVAEGILRAGTEQGNSVHGGQVREAGIG